MKRILRKTISFTLALTIFLSVIGQGSFIYAATESDNAEYKISNLVGNTYSDAVKFKDGYLLLNNGYFNNVTSKTTFTYVDAKGNKKEIKNTAGFTEIYLNEINMNVSGPAYYLDYGVLAVGKDNKVALMDSNGTLFGGKNNFYKEVIYAGDDLFYSLDSSSNKWTLRKKDGTAVKEFSKFDPYERGMRLHSNGYEYILDNSSSKLKLISISSKGEIKEIGSGYTYIYGTKYNSHFVCLSDNAVNAFNEKGQKLFTLKDAASIDLNTIKEYGYAHVRFDNSESYVDLKGNLLVEKGKYTQVEFVGNDRILAKRGEDRFLLDLSGKVKIDCTKFAKEFGTSYKVATYGVYYADSTMAIAVYNTKDSKDYGNTYYIDKNGNKLSGKVSGTVTDFDGNYAAIDKGNDKGFTLIDKKLNEIAKGYGYIGLYGKDSSGKIIAKGYKYESGKDVLLLKDGSIIDKYDYMNWPSDGKIEVSKDGKTGLIDCDGKTIVSLGKYSYFDYEHEIDGFIAYSGDKAYLLDNYGNVINVNNNHKKIGSYSTEFYYREFKDTWTNSYYNRILSNNIAITVNDNDKIGLVKLTKNKVNIAVTSVSLNKSSLKLVKGKTETLQATINPSNATNKEITWSSSDSKIAKVDSNGKVTAVAAGSATITVKTKDGSKTATCKVTVNNTFSTFTVSTPNKNSTSVKGKGLKGATVKAYVGDKEIGKATVADDGSYSIKIAKQKAGTKITVKMSKSGYETVSKSVTVNNTFDTFTVSTPNKNSTAIKGKGVKEATVKAYVGDKEIGKTTVSKDGSYSIKIAKQKAGTKITVKMSKSGYSTASKSVTVAK